MAASCPNAICKGRALFTLLFNNSQRQTFPLFTQWRGSQYNKSYVEPIVDRSILEHPVTTERGKSVKAAPTHMTTAASYDRILNTFINRIMYDADKVTARKIMDKALELIKRTQIENYHKTQSAEEKDKIQLNPVKLFHLALENCKPILIPISVNKGGVRYKVPVPCPPDRQTRMAMKWIIESSRDKIGKMHINLAYELLNASKNEGKSVKKKQEMHRLCEENKAYAHYRW